MDLLGALVVGLVCLFLLGCSIWVHCNRRKNAVAPL
jgi:outer membrane biogenesis lipoprotein LolB